jgi:hypothetical protein
MDIMGKVLRTAPARDAGLGNAQGAAGADGNKMKRNLFRSISNHFEATKGIIPLF